MYDETMGCGITCFKASVSPITINQRVIEKGLERDAEEQALTVKLLLLGETPYRYISYL